MGSLNIHMHNPISRSICAITVGINSFANGNQQTNRKYLKLEFTLKIHLTFEYLRIPFTPARNFTGLRDRQQHARRSRQSSVSGRSEGRSRDSEKVMHRLIFP